MYKKSKKNPKNTLDIQLRIKETFSQPTLVFLLKARLPYHQYCRRGFPLLCDGSRALNDELGYVCWYPETRTVRFR